MHCGTTDKMAKTHNKYIASLPVKCSGMAYVSIKYQLILLEDAREDVIDNLHTASALIHAQRQIIRLNRL